MTARLLLGHVLGINEVALLVRSEESLTADEFQFYMALVYRRSNGEPLQYILGRQEFLGADFIVNPAVLIPRPETETLVDVAYKLYLSLEAGNAAVWAAASRKYLIVDIGTGSGCIAITLAKRIPGARIIATDISRVALEVASLNAQKNGVEDRIEFREGDLFESLQAVQGEIDLIVSNPPYVAERDAAALQREVRDFEPPLALYGGPDGLNIYRRLFHDARSYLRPGGHLVCEIGYGQAELLPQIAAQENWHVISMTPDFQEIPRVLAVKNSTDNSLDACCLT